MILKRHIPFLKSVIRFACTAFGGPNAHIGVMTKEFVEKRKDITQEELIEFFSFCQLLPGPSSTQTITLIGYKRGGPLLAILTLLLWCLPAILIMSSFSFLVRSEKLMQLFPHLFTFIQPMAIGFLLFASWQAMKLSIKNMATAAIMIVVAILSVAFPSPWVFPLAVIAAGIVTNFSNKRIIETTTQPKKIKWINLHLFVLFFIVAGVLSEVARVNHWQHARLFNLFENFYRFGSMVWGGGHALMGAIADQFIGLQQHRLAEPYLNNQEVLTGFGLVSCVPGPVFSVSSYMGGMSMQTQSAGLQVLGCAVASIGVFLPSLLLILFLFPLYNNLKQHVIIYRALEGIYAAVIGIMWASVIKVFLPIVKSSAPADTVVSAIVAISTFLILRYTKISPPIIVLSCLLIGFLFSFM
jgi:chromate transporter